MCRTYVKSCACGAKSASFHFRDNVMSEQVVDKLYCPNCSGEIVFEPKTMVSDNGWIISYDMEAARLLARNGQGSRLSPDVLFDEGYCTWNGVYPGDNIDSVREREAINALAKTDPREYLSRLRTWADDRMTRLRNEGWRKAKR